MSSSARIKPPPLPIEILERVIRVGSFDGRMVFILSSTFAILAAASHDLPGALVGLAAAGAGGLELHGCASLRRGDSRGLDWLVRAQLLLLGAVLIYLAYRLLSFDVATFRAQLPADVVQNLRTSGASDAEIDTVLNRLNELVCFLVGFLTLLYQGGLARYFARRRPVVTQLLDEQPSA